MTYNSRKERAIENFMSGYNCSQSVFEAYSDLFGFDKETALKISASFGAGIGRMRETCWTVCAMFMIAGMFTGCTTADCPSGKKANYDTVQELAQNAGKINEIGQELAQIYKEKYGSIVCRELLGLKKDMPFDETTPDERTKEYYQKRPCVRQVAGACDIIEEYFKEELAALAKNNEQILI